ncbi:MAG TPA: response regulator [Thermoanaerobaculia bacterium]|nr:response regulator [Thermoanaerobaculia bacterium]
MLVVDDDDSIRKLIRSVLRRVGYDVEEARNGQEAIDRIQQRNFDAILLDLMMPIMSGFEVIDYLRQERPDEKCIIVMSAASETRLQQVDRNAVYHLLRKPFDIHELSECVRKCMIKAPFSRNENDLSA